MAYTEEQLKAVFNKTNGNCRICRGTEGPKLKFSSYQKRDDADGWDVERLNSKGEDALQNWWPAHISCISEKGKEGTGGGKKKHFQDVVLLPEQDMELERYLAQLRGTAGL